MQVFGLIAAMAAAGANAGAALLEALATRRGTHAAIVVRQPTYLAGLVLDGSGWLLSAVALRYMPIVAVQAIVAGQVVITVVASHWVLDTALRRVDVAAAGASVIGLGLLVASATTASTPPPTNYGTAILVVALIVLVPTGVVVARQTRRAWPIALLAGLSFSGTAIAVRLIHLQGPLDEVLNTLYSNPLVWIIVAYGALGLGLYTQALRRGTVGRVVAVMAVTETLAPGLVGLVWLGDAIRAGWWPAFTLGLLVALGGVVILARAPVQATHG